MKQMFQLFVFMLALLAVPVSAQVPENVASVDVLTGWRTERGTHMAAVRIQLAPGWKTYWRAPGGGGIPPRFDWSGSRNIDSVRFHWPLPEVFYANGIRSVGYESDLILPMEFTPRQNGGDIRLRAKMDIGVCETVCIPVQFTLDAALPVDGQEWRSAIGNALRQMPMSAGRAGVSAVQCRVEPISDGLTVTAEINMPRLGNSETVVFELPGQSVWISDADIVRSGNVLRAKADFVPVGNQPFALNRSDILITVLGENSGAEINGCKG